MLKSYLFTAVRRLRRDRGYALVNIFGLALGMAVCLLVILLVQDQRSYDRFHTRHNRIVRIVTERTDRTASHHLAATPAYLGPLLEDDLPGIEQTLRIGQIRADVTANEKAFPLEGLTAEPSFFDLFDFELVAGNPSTALEGPGKVVLSDETARMFFGDGDPMGESVEIDGFGGPYVVTGVVRTRGRKSHLRFALLASFATLQSVPEWAERVEAEENYWNFATYALLRDGVTADDVSRRLVGYSRTFGDSRYDLHVQPLTSITLGPSYSNEIAAYNLPGNVVWMLAGLGLLIVLAAGFNYVGIAAAQAVQRTKEVGIRKSVGARRSQIAIQILAESVVIALAALSLASVLFALLVPSFNGLQFFQQFDIELSMNSAHWPAVLASFVLFSVLVGLLAGAYPAARMSGFRPAWMLKGLLGAEPASKGRFRKGLVFLQLVIALCAVTTTLLLYRQFEHMLTADLGFRSANVVTVALQGNDYDVVRGELGRHAGVRRVSAIMRLPSVDGSSQTLVTHDGDTLLAEQIGVAAGALGVLDIPLVAGRDFLDAEGSGLVVSETLARRVGFDNPSDILGALIGAGVTGRDPQPVLGVTRDFAPDAMGGVRPTFFYNPVDRIQRGHAIIEVEPGQAASVLAHAERLWRQIDSAHAFEGGLYDDQVRTNVSYRVFRDVLKTVGFVSILAVVIACLGVVAMTTYNTARRTKEIGVRKVLGAGVWNVVWLLSIDGLLLLAVASAVALPLAYVGNSLWLQNFAVHVHFGAGLLVVASVLVAMLVLLVVGSLALRGALANPADALRYE